MAAILFLQLAWATSLVLPGILTVRSLRAVTTVLVGTGRDAVLACAGLAVPGLALLMEIFVRLALASALRRVEAFDLLMLGPSMLALAVGPLVLLWSAARWAPWRSPRHGQWARLANVVAWALTSCVAVECAISI